MWLIAAAAGFCLGGIAQAQDRVVASVDGIEITTGDVRLAETDIEGKLDGLPADARAVALVEFLINNQLMAAAARREGLDSGDGYRNRLRYYQRRALFEQFIEKHIGKSASPDEARRVYEFELASYKPAEEIRARLIRVEDEAKATALRTQIAQGGDFAKIAQATSLDRATNWLGGDLGYFAKGEMKPWLETAAFALKPGEVSMPVKFEDGWHLVRVEDRRMRPAPAFDEVKDRIVQNLIERKMQAMLATLREKATITFSPAPPGEAKK